jgi:hypothetical protein
MALTKAHNRMIEGAAVNVKDFGAKGDGTTDDSSAFSAVATAASDGDMIIIPAGTYIIGSKVTFSNDKLNVSLSDGAVIKQKSSTLTLDTIIEFSGDYVSITGGKFDGNLAGNSGTYTGRGELLKVSGDYARIRDVVFDGTQDVDNATGLYITGRYGRFENIQTFNTGRNAIRENGDHNVIDTVYMYSLSGSSSNHGIVKDSGYNGNAFEHATYMNVYATTQTAEPFEAILVDHDGVQGNRVDVKNVYIDFPNADGPDCIKLAYVDDVFIDGLFTNHGGDASTNACLRFQQDIKKVSLMNIDLAGAINFDGTIALDLTIGGASHIGRVLNVPQAIQDVPGGNVAIADGVKLTNYTEAAISVRDSDTGNQTKMNIGALILDGDDGTEYFAKYFFSGSTLTFSAGQITIKDPMSITNAKSRIANGRWIGQSDAQDAAAVQGPGGSEFLVSSTDFSTNGPRNVDDWERGMKIRNRYPAAGSTPFYYLCTTGGSSTQTAYANSTAYSVGDRIAANSNVYVCVTAGTSASSGTGPSGTGTGITDGTAVFDYVAARAVFKAVSSVGS